VLERWSLAIGAYGTADGARPQLISELQATLESLLAVDLTLLLDLHGEAAIERLAMLPKRNRFELRGQAYLDRVAQAYREAASKELETVKLDASATPSQVCEQIRIALCAAYPEFERLKFNRVDAGNEQLDLQL
jgi:thymidylate kinase